MDIDSAVDLLASNYEKTSSALPVEQLMALLDGNFIEEVVMWNKERFNYSKDVKIMIMKLLKNSYTTLVISSFEFRSFYTLMIDHGKSRTTILYTNILREYRYYDNVKVMDKSYHDKICYPYYVSVEQENIIFEQIIQYFQGSKVSVYISFYIHPLDEVKSIDTVYKNLLLVQKFYDPPHVEVCFESKFVSRYMNEILDRLIKDLEIECIIFLRDEICNMIQENPYSSEHNAICKIIDQLNEILTPPSKTV